MHAVVPDRFHHVQRPVQQHAQRPVELRRVWKFVRQRHVHQRRVSVLGRLHSLQRSLCLTHRPDELWFVQHHVQRQSGVHRLQLPAAVLRRSDALRKLVHLHAGRREQLRRVRQRVRSRRRVLCEWSVQLSFGHHTLRKYVRAARQQREQLRHVRTFMRPRSGV